MPHIIDDRHLFARLLSAYPRGRVAPVVRWALRPAAWVYGRAVERRRQAYHEGKRPSVDLGVPVISVGNLTAGGTGKTPMVEWIARWCLKNGRRPAILSRGYRAPPDGCNPGKNDEALLLERSLPQTPHYANPDRVAAGRQAVAAGADCLILDDGFQHLRVRRDLNLVLIDVLDPFGGGRPLPAGTLREPLGCLRDADAVVLTRADAIGRLGVQHLRQRIRDWLPERPIFETVHRPVRMSLLSGAEAEGLDWLSGRRVLLFCGLGNPGGFVHTMEKLGAEVVAARFLPDHFAYRPRDLDALAEACVRWRADCAVTTEKDAVKLGAWPGTIPLRVVRVEIEFLPASDAFPKLLKSVLTR